MYLAITVAKYIVSKCMREKSPISNLQLQKLLYLVQKESLAINDEPIFVDEIEAWRFGPAVPNVFFHFSGFGAMPIVMEYVVDKIEDEDKSLIDDVVAQKKMVYPWDYLNEICGDGGAWCRVWDGGAGERKVIPVEMIVEFG
jgi:uncharacterized phage-associated protein